METPASGASRFGLAIHRASGGLAHLLLGVMGQTQHSEGASLLERSRRAYEIVLTARGTSMLPSILPGGRLVLHPRGLRALSPGDVVCYISGNGRPTAHRLLAIETVTSGQRLVVRGDGRRELETIDPSAVIGRVVRVTSPWLSYETDGAIGELLAWLARRVPALGRLVRSVALSVWSAATRRSTSQVVPGGAP